jgi:response regulator NasT
MTASLRIAVADDEPEMRDFLARVLPRFGHQVVAVAENGQQLVDHCRRLQPDLVITDIKMPELDGIEASTQICRERAVPVILVSAYHDPALIERAEADHVVAYLVKPIGLADLQPAIAIAMRRFSEWQSLQDQCAELKQTLADRHVPE